jgi:chromosome transmission fidelity protein 1
MQAFIRFVLDFSQIDELGQSLLNFCSIIPDGVVCFFPSYTYVDHVLQRWRETRLFESLARRKKVANTRRPWLDMRLTF